MKDSYDLAVIGAGPGGYVAAIRAAQLGMDVACVESESREGGLGGVCLNWGCIPTKAMLESANLARHIKDGAADFGIRVKGYELDIGAAVTRSRQISERLTKGVKFLFDKNGVMPIFGRAKLAGGKKLEVELKGGSSATVQASNVIIATGSRPKTFPGFEFDGERVVSSREALEIRKPPGHIVIVGAGSIGMEFADIFNAFGANVTIVEILPQLLPLEDAEIAGVVERSFKKRGIKVKKKTGIKSLEKQDTKLQVTVEGASGEEVIECDTLLMAVGRTPNVEDLGLEAAGVNLDDDGWIAVDEFGRTAGDGIYAIGDVAGNPMLAHKASHEGIVAVEQIAGLPTHPLAREDVPSCTYCHPEVASIGRTEQQAKEDGHQVKVGKFPFSANGRALAAGAPDGMVKIVADAKYGEVLGVHMVGHNVTELIAETGLGRTLETTVHEIATTVHAHPTLSETVMEAALAALGRPIHI
ncbi:MAG: dihydrolipoyl dehydrogenase [Gemmatimonadetes bacterium]|nr:dihydrolipoyl dehydrogenase [Gemmatimonadota bacterium]NIO32154.1 dihydrolipoyl dehydrogenase [Gemmatimonadota bacterium]